MSVKIKYIPSVISEQQGIKAAFDGERVSYNGEYFSEKPVIREYYPGDGFGILEFNEDFSLTGEIRKGTKTLEGRVTDVRIRVTSQEAGWDKPGFTAFIPEVRLNNGPWGTHYGLIPVSTQKEISALRKEAAIKFIKATIRQRKVNGFKSGPAEIKEFCNQSWANGMLSAQEAIKIGLAELQEA